MNLLTAFFWLFISNTFILLHYSFENNNIIKNSLRRKWIFDHNNIINNRDHHSYNDGDIELYYKDNQFIKNKKLISISPGGFKGFYLLGVLSYMKENYDMEEFVFSGASAGAWNALFMCFNGNTMEFVYNLLDYNIKKAKTIMELQYFLKYKLLSTYDDTDFEMRRLFIGVTNLKNFKPKTNIYTDFENLEDAISCCMASSHIPLITGGLTNRYHNMFSFDGGFSKYPYLNIKNATLHVSPNMWHELKEPHKNHNKPINQLRQFSEFFSVSKNNLLELYDNGYQDARKHKHLLDKILPEKRND